MSICQSPAGSTRGFMLFGLEGASTDIAGDRHRGTSESQDFRMPLVPPRQDKSNDAGFAVLGPMASAAPTAFRFGCPHAGRLLTASLVLARRGVLRRLSRGWVAAAKCLDPKLQLRFTRSTNDKFGAGVEMARLHRRFARYLNRANPESWMESWHRRETRHDPRRSVA